MHFSWNFENKLQQIFFFLLSRCKKIQLNLFIAFLFEQIAGLDLNDRKDSRSLCSDNAEGQARYIPPHLRSSGGNNNSAEAAESDGYSGGGYRDNSAKVAVITATIIATTGKPECFLLVQQLATKFSNWKMVTFGISIEKMFSYSKKSNFLSNFKIVKFCEKFSYQN